MSEPIDKEQKEQQYRVAVTQGDIREIKRDVTELAVKVNDIHVAFIGSKLADDGGIMKRIKDLEEGVEKNKERIDAFELSTKEKLFYLRIIWGIGGALALAIITIVGHIFLK